MRGARQRLVAVLGGLAAVAPGVVSAELIERIEYRRGDAGVAGAPLSARVQTVALVADAPPGSLPSGALHGLARWDIRWSAPLARRPDGGCAVTRPITVLTFVITLPESPADDSPARPQLQWQLDALGMHEAGHLVIAQATAGRVDAGLRAIEPATDCTLLARDAERLAHAAIQQGRHDQAAYDVLTEQTREPNARPLAPR